MWRGCRPIGLPLPHNKTLWVLQLLYYLTNLRFYHFLLHLWNRLWKSIACHKWMVLLIVHLSEDVNKIPFPPVLVVLYLQQQASIFQLLPCKVQMHACNSCCPLPAPPHWLSRALPSHLHCYTSSGLITVLVVWNDEGMVSSDVILALAVQLSLYTVQSKCKQTLRFGSQFGLASNTNCEYLFPQSFLCSRV